MVGNCAAQGNLESRKSKTCGSRRSCNAATASPLPARLGSLPSRRANAGEGCSACLFVPLHSLEKPSPLHQHPSLRGRAKRGGVPESLRFFDKTIQDQTPSGYCVARELIALLTSEFQLQMVVVSVLECRLVCLVNLCAVLKVIRFAQFHCD